MSDVFICAQCRKIFAIDESRCCPKCHSFNIKMYDGPHFKEESKKENVEDTTKYMFSRTFLVCIILILVSWIGYSEVFRDVVGKESVNQNIALKIYERDRKAFEAAKKIGTLKSYQEFLTKYPNSVWRDYGIYFRDKAALDEAKRDGSLEAIVDFINSYPDSGWLSNAQYYLRDTFGDIREVETNTKKNRVTVKSEGVANKQNLSKSNENNVVQQTRDTQQRRVESSRSTSVVQTSVTNSSADKLFQSENYDMAIMHYQNIIASPTSDTDMVAYALFHQALCFQRLQDHGTAKVIFKKLIKKIPSSEYSAKARKIVREM